MAEGSTIETSSDELLISAGVRVSPITYPDYMPKGEVRVEDPYGYTLLIGQAG